MDIKRKAYHYLFNRPSGVAECERIDGKTVRLALPESGKVVGTNIDQLILQASEYELPIDERVRQTLVVFDGLLLVDGLPKSAQVIKQEKRSLIALDKSKIRQQPDGVEHFAYGQVIPKPYGEKGEPFWYPHIKIVRHFVLLPTGKACVQGWQPPAFIAKYRMVVVEKNGDDVKVTWLNTDA